MNKKLNVVLLCHFSNSKVQKYINPIKSVKEYGQWIPNLIEHFENKNEVSLHVIATHEYISKTKIFEINGIKYYFINRGIPIIGRHWPKFLPVDVWLDYYGIKSKVKQLVNKIQPDIIHLHGAENTYHTAAAPQFHNKLPILVTLQGFISKHDEANSFRVKRRKKRERYILENFKHFTYGRKITRDEVKAINPQANFYHHKYVRKFYLNNNHKEIKKQFDIVFFARIKKEKGIEDLLKATSLIKKKKKDISILIIGNINKQYKNHLHNLIAELGLQNNVTFTGFLPSQQDVHHTAQKAKVSVLPTYIEVFSGTIAESMFLNIPVVAYATGGIPEANENEEVISLVEPGNINMLAEKMDELLSDRKLRELQAQKAQKRIKEMFDDTNTYSNLLNIYKKVIHDFHNNKNN